jgi:integrase
MLNVQFSALRRAVIIVARRLLPNTRVKLTARGNAFRIAPTASNGGQLAKLKALLEVALITGARIGELLTLRGEDCQDGYLTTKRGSRSCLLPQGIWWTTRGSNS